MKFRSKNDYAQIYSGDKKGYNLGLDSAMYIRKQANRTTFAVPRIGTQGKSVSDVNAATDISTGTDDKLKVSVDGSAAQLITLTLAGLTTGQAIAAELESKINSALLASGLDSRVYVSFYHSDDHYEIISQFTGTTSSVVVTNADSNNIADDLKLGTANGGTETAGTNDKDFLLFTTGGATYNQPIEPNAHRSGRFNSGIIKQKKVAEFSFSKYVNMAGSPGDSLDEPVRLLWEQLLGSEEVVAGTAIRYKQALPSFYFSLVRVSTIFGEYYRGAYVRDMTLTIAGDAPATEEWSGRAGDRSVAGLAKFNGGVSSSNVITLVDGEADLYSQGALVMVVDTDGRTILYGADGSLSVTAVDTTLHKITINSNITASNGSFLVPFDPGAVQQTARDNIYTDLIGQFKIKASGPNIDVTSITLSFENDHEDLDNYFGYDTNAGFVAGNRMNITLEATFNLSNETMGAVIQTGEFKGFSPVIILGDVSGRHLKISAPKWMPSVPAIEVPESGVTEVTLEGLLLESSPGAKNPILVEFK